ncbi:hypothetical protein D9619_000767 [Psilocybe cf. subviscida]|uniref:Uncharacterized protein n=1 Tax=Psilocybe cf. subviscida TaxID=2480587 RepID=A0A8H5F2N1_9AGAR|nr:hypothetical protein D9619_000767 [Psilocybe cf. subviscida]
MPRIIPRLIQKIAEQSDHAKFSFPPAFRRNRAKKSLYQPPPLKPTYNARDYEQSILLKPSNPVTNKKAYVRHKTLAPRQYGQPSPQPGEVDPTRLMNDSEYNWWANPYLRMLTSPLRKCIVTGRHLPTDLLIRLVALRVSAARIRHKGDPAVMVPVIVPDGLQHPKFTRRVAGGAIYAHCWKQVIERIQTRFHHYPRVPGCVASPHLDHQIAHQLRLRVVQEFVFLADRLENLAKAKRWKDTKDPVPVTLRRLTYEEWGHMKMTGTAPYEDAVAIIILPPVNRDTVTKKRPEPSTSALPPDDEQHPKDLPPVSTLLPAVADDQIDASLPDILPTLKIPLYNGVSCFPSRSQRRALHSTLKRILDVESVFNATRPKRGNSAKLSHAFLLCSSGSIAKWCDPAAAAVALWRLRMYEGDGWSKEPIG